MERSVSAESYPRAGWLSALVLCVACHTVPVTGRHSFNTFSAADDVQIGREAYQQVLEDAKLVTSGPKFEMVKRIMTRIAGVADDQGFEWEVNLIQDDKTVNAFALPGGKMAVYTGILPVCETEAGLAVVMGHEIGHVVAQHGTERMTSTLGLDAFLSLINIGDYAQIAQLTLDVLVNLPFGRAQESEADEIGLQYMARAGYDPREAIAFWQRMESTGGDSPPEFLSTHPAHETRVENLRKHLPKALDIWRAAGGGGSY